MSRVHQNIYPLRGIDKKKLSLPLFRLIVKVTSLKRANEYNKIVLGLRETI